MHLRTEFSFVLRREYAPGVEGGDDTGTGGGERGGGGTEAEDGAELGYGREGS